MLCAVVELRVRVDARRDRTARRMKRQADSRCLCLQPALPPLPAPCLPPLCRSATSAVELPLLPAMSTAVKKELYVATTAYSMSASLMHVRNLCCWDSSYASGKTVKQEYSLCADPFFQVHFFLLSVHVLKSFEHHLLNRIQ